MGLILWIIFGALVGWVASMIMGTDQQQGGLANIIIGIVGALLGGLIAQMLGASGITGFDITSFLVALAGAIVLIALTRVFTRSA